MSIITKNEIEQLYNFNGYNFRDLWRELAVKKSENTRIANSDLNKILKILGKGVTFQDLFSSMSIDYNTLFYIGDEDGGEYPCNREIFYHIIRFIVNKIPMYFDENFCVNDIKAFKNCERAKELYSCLKPFLDTRHMDWEDCPVNTIFTNGDDYIGIKLSGYNPTADWYIDILQFVNILTGGHVEDCYDACDSCISLYRKLDQVNIRNAMEYMEEQICEYNKNMEKIIYNGEDKQLLTDQFNETIMNLCELFTNINFVYVLTPPKLTDREKEEKRRKLEDIERMRKALLKELGEQ